MNFPAEQLEWALACRQQAGLRLTDSRRALLAGLSMQTAPLAIERLHEFSLCKQIDSAATLVVQAVVHLLALPLVVVSTGGAERNITTFGMTQGASIPNSLMPDRCALVGSNHKLMGGLMS